MYSLRTRSAAVASARARRAAQQLDEHWYHFCVRDVDLPGKHLLRMAWEITDLGLSVVHPQTRIFVAVSEAVSKYCGPNDKGWLVAFRRAAQRNDRRARPFRDTVTQCTDGQASSGFEQP